MQRCSSAEPPAFAPAPTVPRLQGNHGAAPEGPRVAVLPGGGPRPRPALHQHREQPWTVAEPTSAIALQQPGPAARCTRRPPCAAPSPARPRPRRLRLRPRARMRTCRTRPRPTPRTATHRRGGRRVLGCSQQATDEQEVGTLPWIAAACTRHLLAAISGPHAGAGPGGRGRGAGGEVGQEHPRQRGAGGGGSQICECRLPGSGRREDGCWVGWRV